MTACEKNSVEEMTTLKSEVEESSLQSGQSPIEYVSLEELNAIFVENELTPITLDELGVSQEEYDKVQAQLNNPNIARSRCSGNTATTWLDIDDSGFVSAFDILRVRQFLLIKPEAWLNGITQDEYDTFGFATDIWPTIADGASGPPATSTSRLTLADVLVGYKVILGIYVCQ